MGYNLVKRFIFALFVIILGINVCRMALMPEYRQIYVVSVLKEASRVENNWVDTVRVLGDIRNDLISTVSPNFGIATVKLLFIDNSRLVLSLLKTIFAILSLIFNVFGLPLPFTSYLPI